MKLSNVFQKLRALTEDVPNPIRLPTESEIDSTEKELGVVFPVEFRSYLKLASDVVFGTIEPVTITAKDHTDIIAVANDAWELGIPKNFIPICEDNGDYYCVAPNGSVHFCSHNGTTDESWSDIEHWINDVWMNS